ncbi:MAG: hypothetical protein V2J65_01690 [Desulfobacteraceae bacterium]|jgi:hypothetical protein|nr:hypothetical protein [Desulfobacteraceae bacterium]
MTPTPTTINARTAANSRDFLQSGAEGFAGDGVSGGEDLVVFDEFRLALLVSSAFFGGRIVEFLGTSEIA